MFNYSTNFASKKMELNAPILYLTNYYTNIPHQRYIDEQVNHKYLKHIDNKFATNFLINTINEIKKEYKSPIMLFCEPILGDNPKSITYKNYKMSDLDRYNTLIEYYKKLGLTNEIETNNTLHNYLWWDDKFKYSRRMRASLYGYL